MLDRSSRDQGVLWVLSAWVVTAAAGVQVFTLQRWQLAFAIPTAIIGAVVLAGYFTFYRPYRRAMMRSSALRAAREANTGGQRSARSLG
ncbi:MAG TPA: hypothetical protein VHA57_07395 [Actinomycetota bacterium]|nr:hypothetical protein [Actinomycetota bacterium]